MPIERKVRERRAGSGAAGTAARSPARKKPAYRPIPSTTEAPEGRPADDRVAAATGRGWEALFALLDRGGARARTHAETAAYLVREQGVGGWWAQTITVWYQRARGLRLQHQQADGFTVSASKTVAVPLDVLFDAFASARSRRRWLADGTMSLRSSRPGRGARFDWNDGATRLDVSFVAKGPARATVTVAHERLPSPDEAAAAKAAWRQRLVRLAEILEG